MVPGMKPRAHRSPGSRRRAAKEQGAMTDSYRALCSDSYVNMKLSVKLELPRGRDTVLEMFERVRKQYPGMGTFRRYREELALESPQTDLPHRWLAVRSNTVRSGSVNAPTLDAAYGLHRLVLESAPFYLNVSPLDVDYVELLYGFDLSASGNHDSIVFDALWAGSPMARLLEGDDARPIDCQPLIGVSFGSRADVEVYFEVKTRAGSTHGAPRDPEHAHDPISVYLTLRKFGAVQDLKDLPAVLSKLSSRGEELVESSVVPTLLVPLRDAIASGGR